MRWGDVGVDLELQVDWRDKRKKRRRIRWSYLGQSLR